MSPKAIKLRRRQMHRLSNSFRMLVVVASMTAWFVASNHCALAAISVTAKATVGSQCPMHAQKQHSPQRGKNNGCGDLPCCKNLQAAPTVATKLVSSPVWLGALITFFSPIAGETSGDTAQISFCLDTGPPGETSFAELVLQRSILAHAPPVLLS